MGACEAVIPEYSFLKLSEVMPNPVGSDTNNEWVELYNSSDSNISLEGLTLSDSKGIIKTFGANDFIRGGEYLVTKIPGSKLNNCSGDCEDSVILKRGDTEIDMMSYDSVTSGQSLSITILEIWDSKYLVTPGFVNREVPISPVTLMLTEVVANPLSGGSEWLEIFNYGEESIELKGWKLADSSGSSSLGGGTVEPGNYYVINPGVSLNNSGDSITLISPDGKDIDKITYIKSLVGVARARKWQEGYGTSWRSTTSLTPGSRNIIKSPEKENQEEDTTAKAISGFSKELPTNIEVVYPTVEKIVYGLPRLSAKQSSVVKYEEVTIPIWPLFLGVSIVALVVLGLELGYHRKITEWLET